jgi:hypothetical protein
MASHPSQQQRVAHKQIKLTLFIGEIPKANQRFF